MSKINNILSPERTFVLANLIMATDVILNLWVDYILKNDSSVLEGDRFGLAGLAVVTLSLAGLCVSIYSMVRIATSMDTIYSIEITSLSTRKKGLLVLYALIFSWLVVGGSFMMVVSGINFMG